MMKVGVVFSFMMCVCLYACTSNQKDNTDINAPDADSAKRQNGEGRATTSIGVFTPPDSTYTGDYFEKYPSGVIKVRGTFRFGKKNGKWMYFFPDGTLWSEAFFHDNKMNGESNVYHPNGKIMYNGHYKLDMADSVWCFYDTTGKLVEKRDYNKPEPKKK
jgi:antitoxin component YwqK of YwqJK toxin-antitoxin module